MYFKIKLGYNNEFLSINEQELEIALFAFITDGKAVFKNGVIRGKDIISITEDWHKEMCWNNAHKLDELDYDELKQKGIDKKYEGVIGEAKEKVQYLISTNQTHLLGKDIEMPKIDETKKIDTSSLSNKFKI